MYSGSDAISIIRLIITHNVNICIANAGFLDVLLYKTNKQWNIHVHKNAGIVINTNTKTNGSVAERYAAIIAKTVAVDNIVKKNRINILLF